MAVTYNISTFTNLIDDLREEIHDDRLSVLADEQIQNWINRAQERISDLVLVQDQYNLGLNDDVETYYFQDRPAITGATNATPIVVTAASHGLSDDDRVTIRGVLGNTNANGRFQVDNVAANTFELLKYADLDNAEAGTSTVTVTTIQDHPFSTGNSVVISGVAGMTDLNATHTVTVTGLKTFTVPVTTTQSYTSGGIATKSAAGNAAYTAGGRFWRDDEIPTFFKDFKRGQRTWSTDYHPVIEMCQMDWLVDQERADTAIAKSYTDYGSPRYAALGMENSIRQLKVYPSPTYDQEVTFFGSIRVTARSYDSDALTASIILPSFYDATIIVYVKMKIYEWLKDRDMRVEMFTEFNGEINRLRLRNPAHLRVRVTYQ